MAARKQPCVSEAVPRHLGNGPRRGSRGAVGMSWVRNQPHWGIWFLVLRDNKQADGDEL